MQALNCSRSYKKQSVQILYVMYFFYGQAAVSAPNAFAAGSQNHQAVRNKAKTNVDLILFCFVYFFFFAGNSQ